MLRLTKKDLIGQIKIMRNDLIDGCIDSVVDNCGTYKRINETEVFFWGITKKAYDYMVELKDCTLLKTPAFKKEVAKFIVGDFKIIGDIKIIVNGMFGTAEVRVDVEELKTGKVLRDMCYLWDNNCNYSIYKELEKEYPDAQSKWEKESKIKNNIPEVEVHMADAFQAELVNAIQDEVPAILEKMFIREDMMADEYDTLGDCFRGCHDGLRQVTVANLRRMLEKCLEKNEITDTEIFVINFAYEHLELSDDMFTMMEILRFKKENIMPDYENFIVGSVHISVDEEKIAKFELCNLKVEMNHKEKEVLVYDVTKQLEGQVDLISYEKSIEKSQRLESPKRISKKEKITFDIDGEGALFLTEKKDVDYKTAQKEYRLRLQHAPDTTYNKTDFDLKINGECVYGFRVDLSKSFDHKFNLWEELLRNLRFQKRVWSGEEYSWMQGEYREKRIKEQFGTEKEMIEFFDKIEKILVGLDSPEPTPETTTNKKANKMEEKEMKAINKNGLNNRMVKLGEFLKENKDVDIIESKVFELFPNAMEMEVFEGDDVVYFLVGQDYAGKAPTKKEMKEIDCSFKEVNKVYGLSIYASVEKEKIKISANVGIDYTDKYDHRQYTDYTVKEIEIELDLTMEIAKEVVETTRAKHNEEKISATCAWDRIKELTQRNTTDEVLDFLIEELTYYAHKEKEEKEKENINKIEVGICKTDLLVQNGTMWREKAEQRLESLYKYASTPELEELVDLAIKYIAVSKDENIRLPKKLQEILDRRYKKVIDEKIKVLDEKITGTETAEQIQTILNREFRNISKIDENEVGYCVESEILEHYRGKIKEQPADAVQILRGGEVYAGITLLNGIMMIYIKTKVEYLDKNGEFKTYTEYLYHKKINQDLEENKMFLDSGDKSEDILELEESGLDNMIKEHINAIIDLCTQENNGVGYMYKKTVATKKANEYQLTSLFEDIWTGMSVYIGDSANMILTPNSEKSFLTGIIDSLLSNSQSINITIKEIKEKIKRKFEYSYSRSVTVIEPDETKVYVLVSTENTEVFWNYEDAYKKMVNLATEVAEEWSYSHKLEIKDYSAKVDIFQWTIMEKTIL